MKRVRNTAPVAARAEALERKKACSAAANIVRAWLMKRRLLGIMSRNALDNLELLVDDLEAGAA